MITQTPGRSVSRRTAVAGLGAGGLGLALTHRGGTAAQDGASDLAGHSLVGTWAVMTPGGVVPQTHGSDGSFNAAFPANYVDPDLGLTFQGPALGRWEADDERSAHFTAIQALSDANGAYVGTFQFSGAFAMTDDGQSWSSTDTPTRVIVRDAANNVVFDQEMPNDPPVTATRVGATAESVVLPVTPPSAATPAP